MPDAFTSTGSTIAGAIPTGTGSSSGGFGKTLATAFIDLLLPLQTAMQVAQTLPEEAAILATVANIAAMPSPVALTGSDLPSVATVQTLMATQAPEPGVSAIQDTAVSKVDLTESVPVTAQSVDIYAPVDAAGSSSASVTDTLPQRAVHPRQSIKRTVGAAMDTAGALLQPTVAAVQPASLSVPLQGPSTQITASAPGSVKPELPNPSTLGVAAPDLKPADVPSRPEVLQEKVQPEALQPAPTRVIHDRQTVARAPVPEEPPPSLLSPPAQELPAPLISQRTGTGVVKQPPAVEQLPTSVPVSDLAVPLASEGRVETAVIEGRQHPKSASSSASSRVSGQSVPVPQQEAAAGQQSAQEMAPSTESVAFTPSPVLAKAAVAPPPRNAPASTQSVASAAVQQSPAGTVRAGPTTDAKQPEVALPPTVMLTADPVPCQRASPHATAAGDAQYDYTSPAPPISDTQPGPEREPHISMMARERESAEKADDGVWLQPLTKAAESRTTNAAEVATPPPPKSIPRAEARERRLVTHSGEPGQSETAPQSLHDLQLADQPASEDPTGEQTAVQAHSVERQSRTEPELTGHDDLPPVSQPPTASVIDQTGPALAGEPLRQEVPPLSLEGGVVSTAHNVEQLAALPDAQREARQAEVSHIRLPMPLDDKRWGDAMSARVTWQVGAGIQQAHVHLNPPELGPVGVSVELTDGQAKVHFQAEHPLVRDSLQEALPRLKDMFSQAGLNLADTNVSQWSTSGQQGQNQPQRGLQQWPWQAAEPEQLPVPPPVRVRQHLDGVIDAYV